MDSEKQTLLTSPRPSAAAESHSSPSGGRRPPPTADSRPTQGRRTIDLDPRGRGQPATAPTPRVLVLSCESRKLSSLSPFQRKQGCDRFGKVLRCDKLKDGGIEVEFANERAAKCALTATHFEFTTRDAQGKRETKLPIHVSPHRTKNSSRGVIYCVDLENVSDGDIEEGLSEFGVLSARRIHSRRAGVSIPTHNIMLTFDQIDLPREVTVGYIRVKVRPYIPNPMRCFQCLRFGHTRADCNNKPTCSLCASTEHTGDQCSSETRRCVNCGSSQMPHGAFDPKCPAFLKEKEIAAIKATERVSFKEARERYNAMHPSRSYASVARETPVSRPVTQEQEQQPRDISQLISLLQSFGLTLSGPGIPSGPATPCASRPTAAVATAATQTYPTKEVSGSNPGGDCTLTGGPCDSGHTKAARSGASPPPPPPRRPGPPPPTAVSEALRRGQEEQRAFEERQARRVQKAMEARSSSGAEAAPAPLLGTRPPQPPGQLEDGSPQTTPVSTPIRPPQESAAMEALRRSDEEKRARDARRARMVERAREARQAPSAAGGAEGSASSGSASLSSEAAAGGGPVDINPGGLPLMGPPPRPPPPPQLQRPGVPPPPLPLKSPSGVRPLETPPSAPPGLEPPPAPVRPTKRVYAESSSPSEAETPRTRRKSHTHSGRANSADGRLLRGEGAHPRIQFGDGAPSNL